MGISYPESVGFEEKSAEEQAAAKVQEKQRQKKGRQDESEKTTPGAPVRPRTR